MDKNIINAPKKSKFWGLSSEETRHQVENYNTLKWHKSYRKLGGIIFIVWGLFSIIVAIGILDLSPAYIVESIIFLVFGFLVYRGKKFAMYTMLILLTVEMVARMIEGWMVYERFRFWPILTWIVIAPIVYNALCVERNKRLREQIR